jgi:hypothetical protein
MYFCGRPPGDNYHPGMLNYLYRLYGMVNENNWSSKLPPERGQKGAARSYDLTERGNKEMNVTTMTSYKATNLTF